MLFYFHKHHTKNMITKKPEIKVNYHKVIYGYKNARTAFEDILINEKSKECTILLPAFIGYSEREGSGVFDPVKSTNIKYDFYKMSNQLFINIKDLEEKIKKITGKKIILIVHYFGYIDPQYSCIFKLCRQNNIKIIEDSAHAFFTDYFSDRTKLRADYVIYSLHKLFPFNSGGMLEVNTREEFVPYHKINLNYHIWEYDLKEIAIKRIHNARILEKLLRNTNGLKILRYMEEFQNNVPQTFPIMLEKGIDRYNMYLKLNELGFGVVSLYHTLIRPLYNDQYKVSVEASKSILNLPVHQDVSEQELFLLCGELKKIIDEGK